MPIDLLPAFLMAVLACWLGLSLLVRAPRDRATQAFAWLCLHLTLYGLATVLPALSQSREVGRALELVQLVETVLLPPVFLHFIIVLVGDGRTPLWQRAALAFFYLTGLAMAIYALLPGALDVRADGMLSFGSWLIVPWTLQRALPMLLALTLLFKTYRGAAGDDLERRRRTLIGSAAVVGVIGALWATVARNRGFSPAIGHALMCTALALLAYAVLAYRSLLPARVAQRTFYRSMLGGILTALYVGVLLVAEFGPLRDWAGAWIDRRFFHREFDYGRLLRTLGDDLFQRGDLQGQLQAALAAICRTLAARAGAVAVQEGGGLRVLAAYGVEPMPEDALRGVAPPDTPQTHYGDWRPWPDARLLLPLRRGDETLGLLALGAKRSGEPYRETERALLLSLGAYLALAITHDRSQHEEQLAMAALAEQSRQLQAEQELLAAQAAEAI